MSSQQQEEEATRTEQEEEPRPSEWTMRPLSSDEIGKIWTLDRREVIEKFYRMENDGLVLGGERHVCKGWPRGHPAHFTPLFEPLAVRGLVVGMFDGEKMIGVVVVGDKIFGDDFVKLEFLHVDRSYRDKGVGKRLFLKATEMARKKARWLYVSATPSEHTINFYKGLGCVLITPDPEQYKLEPEDIHLGYELILGAQS